MCELSFPGVYTQKKRLAVVDALDDDNHDNVFRVIPTFLLRVSLIE